ncbi:MAG: peptidylprolyl isomerase [Balneolia bacterium]|nr:peptidylprolyl isomerase [Balneolia bacterium]
MKPSGSIRFLALFIIAASFAGCSLFKSASDDVEATVVGSVDGTDVTYGELRANFFSSPLLEEEDPDLTRQEIMEFLDLYLVYLAKVQATKDDGFYDDPEVLAELEQYQMQSVFPYWLEMRFRDELLDEMVERAQYEVGTSHVLIAVREDATPADTLEAYNRLMEARELFLSEEDTRSFVEISNEYSSSQRGQSMGGDLGFISAGWAVKPFEDVTYTTEVGDVSMPFRTSFGYHIVHVYDKRETVPEKNYSHIYFRTRGANVSEEASMEKAQEAYAQLNEGGDWDEITMEFSEDPDTRSSGGDIGWIQRARYQPIFLENIEQLEEQGTFTEPFVSEYGIHIVRLDSIRTYESDEQFRDAMYERLRALPRYRENRTITLENVRRTAGDSLHTSTYEFFLEVHDSHPGLNVLELDFTDEQLEMPIYTIADQTYTLQEFITFVARAVENTNDRRYRHNLLDVFKDEKAEDVIVQVTKDEFPDFKELSQRYHEGLAVFKLTETEVWNYAAQDTARLKEIFEANAENYAFGTRYRYYRISADSESKIEEAKEAIHNGTDIDDIREAVSGLIVRTDVINSLQDFPFDYLQGVEPGEFSDIFEYRNRKTVLFLTEILEPRPMTFEEAFMRVVADFQPIRDEEWNNELRERYNVIAYPERLREVLDQVDI